jgi:hypothetical protein
MGNLPGNCAACRSAYALTKAKEPPCADKCPKFALFPDNPNPNQYGLDPKNAFAAEMYNLAARDQRVGMDAVLIGTLTASDARDTIDLYENHLPSPLSRQQTFEKMRVLDHAVTRARGDAEFKKREEATQRQSAGQGRRKVR